MISPELSTSQKPDQIAMHLQALTRAFAALPSEFTLPGTSVRSTGVEIYPDTEYVPYAAETATTPTTETATPVGPLSSSGTERVLEEDGTRTAHNADVDELLDTPFLDMTWPEWAGADPAPVVLAMESTSVEDVGEESTAGSTMQQESVGARHRAPEAPADDTQTVRTEAQPSQDSVEESDNPRTNTDRANTPPNKPPTTIDDELMKEPPEHPNGGIALEHYIVRRRTLKNITIDFGIGIFKAVIGGIYGVPAFFPRCHVKKGSDGKIASDAIQVSEKDPRTKFVTIVGDKGEHVQKVKARFKTTAIIKARLKYAWRMH